MDDEDRKKLNQIAEDAAYMRGRFEIYEERVDGLDERVHAVENRVWSVGGIGAVLGGLLSLIGASKLHGPL